MQDMTADEDERGEQWGGGHGLGPSVSLFSWGPGDSIIVSAASTHRARPAHESFGGGDVLMPLMPTGGIDGTGCTLLEYRMHNPWGLWRHQRYVQRPFQLFFAEAHNVWSERIRETIAIGMDRSEDPVKKGNEEPLKKQQRRRDLLSDETRQYKELYGTLMARVFEYPDTELHDERENWRQLGRLLYRGHQAWHLAHIIITHLSRPNPAHQQAHRDLPFDLPFDLVHWLQEHTPADVFNAATSQPFLGNEPNETWWRSMCNFVMHFYIDQAVSMLEQLKGDGKCGQDGYTMVEQIKMLLLELKDMEDRVDQNKDIRQSWRQWKKRQEWMTIDRLIRSNKSPICAHVDVLMRILMGQEDAIAKHAQNWLQNVAARMMFGRTEAVLGVADLASLTEDALNIDTPEPDEAVLVHLMRLDMQAAVQHFFTTLQDWWSAAHLADVLYRGLRALVVQKYLL